MTTTFNTSTELTSEEYSFYYKIIGKPFNYEFNYNPKLTGYIVTKQGDNFTEIIKNIEKASNGKLSAITFEYENRTQTCGTKAGWYSDGTKSTWLKVIKKG